MTPPLKHEPDLGQLVDDIELIVPWALLFAAALAGIAATGGLHLLVFPSAYVDVVLWLSTLAPWK